MSKGNSCDVLTLKPSRHGGFDVIGVDKSRVTVYEPEEEAGPCPCYEENEHQWYGHCGRDKDGNKYEGICFCGAAIPRFDDGRNVYTVDENYLTSSNGSKSSIRGGARKSKKTRKSRKGRKGRKGSRKH